MESLGRGYSNGWRVLGVATVADRILCVATGAGKHVCLTEAYLLDVTGFLDHYSTITTTTTTK